MFFFLLGVAKVKLEVMTKGNSLLFVDTSSDFSLSLSL